MNTLISVVAHVAGGRVEPQPPARPESAVDRLRQRREDDYFSSLEEEIAQAHQRWLKEHPEEV